MLRAGMLALTGMNGIRFNLLRTRGQLPFTVGATAGTSRWTEFSVEDAFRLRLMMALTEEAGAAQVPSTLGPNFASSVVRNSGASFEEANGARPALHIGHATFEGLDREGEVEHWAAHYYGTLAGLPEWIERHCTDDAYSEIALSRIFMANATAAAHFVALRALEIGIRV